MKKSHAIIFVAIAMFMAFIIPTALLSIFPTRYTTPPSPSAIDPVPDSPPLTPLLHDVKG